MNKEWLNKFVLMERELSERYGEFNLFALFQRKNSPNRWDLLVAADWLPEANHEAREMILEEIRHRFEPDEILYLTMVVVLNDDIPGMDEVYEEIQVKHGMVKLRDEIFFNKDIDRAYVITSQRCVADAT